MHRNAACVHLYFHYIFPFFCINLFFSAQKKSETLLCFCKKSSALLTIYSTLFLHIRQVLPCISVSILLFHAMNKHSQREKMSACYGHAKFHTCKLCCGWFRIPACARRAGFSIAAPNQKFSAKNNTVDATSATRVDAYNRVRPYEALEMRTPSDVYIVYMLEQIWQTPLQRFYVLAVQRLLRHITMVFQHMYRIALTKDFFPSLYIESAESLRTDKPVLSAQSKPPLRGFPPSVQTAPLLIPRI